MFCLFILSTVMGVAVSGRSPNADFVERVFTDSGARYSTDIQTDAQLDVPGLVARYGYPIEVHEVTTADGYILTMHRIPHGKDRDPIENNCLVFGMHGLFSSSAEFLVQGPGNALGYYLADNGCDVWLGNARGNFYSRRHLSLDPDDNDDQEFWQFSWDNIGYYDLPAFIDYILGVTGQSKLHYIGHSQGTTTFMVLNSLRPEYNEKFISFQALAPAAFFTYNDNAVFRSLAPFEAVVENAAFAIGRAEILQNAGFFGWFVDNFCQHGSIFEILCEESVGFVNFNNVNVTMLPIFFGHAPAGASIRQLAHYGQSIRFNTFRRYNYNILRNLIRYGSITPPDYDLSRITVPSYIYYSTGDTIVQAKDIVKLCDRLPNLVNCYLIPSENFGHIDFVWANSALVLLYEKILSQIREAEEL